ncbi:MAG: hypothetical protein GY749_13470 [Desulfobacteraceae bacterium]|nr:hypothetical protein [Desulfobacteraceae bacterium]
MTTQGHTEGPHATVEKQLLRRVIHRNPGGHQAVLVAGRSRVIASRFDPVAPSRPTEQDRVEAIRRLLAGMTAGSGAVELTASVGDLHPENNTFPGEVFMGLAADALEVAGIGRTNPILFADLCSRFLPEVEFRGKENRKIRYAVFAATALRAGLDPDVLEEVSWWPDNYWRYALYATVALIRASADHQQVPVADLARQLADLHGIELI